MASEDTPDRNTRGLPLALRAAGVVLSLAAFWATSTLLSSEASPRTGAAFFEILGYVWAWFGSPFARKACGYFTRTNPAKTLLWRGCRGQAMGTDTIEQSC